MHRPCKCSICFSRWALKKARAGNAAVKQLAVTGTQLLGASEFMSDLVLERRLQIFPACRLATAVSVSTRDQGLLLPLSGDSLHPMPR